VIEKANLKDIYPLSPMQEGMLFHALYDKDSSAYIEQSSYRVRGDLRVGLFHESWNALFERHDILRTVFVHEKTPRPLQVVQKRCQVPFYYEDLRRKSPDDKTARLAEYRARERGRAFDLARDVLLRVAVFQLEDHLYEVIRTHHHILLDGWSSGILLKELLEIHQALKEGRCPHLQEAAAYSKYIQWVEGRGKDVSERYWRAYLEGYEDVASPPALRSSKPHGDHDPGELAFQLDEKDSRGLEALAARYGATMGTLVQTVWGILLGRYNHTRDVVFGTVVSGRPPQVSGIEQMVGLFINALPIRVRSAPEDTFSRLLQRVQRQSLEAGEHLYLPLAVIQGKRGLVDHLVAFENYPVDPHMQAAVDGGGYGLKVEGVTRYGHTHYKFALVVNPGARLCMVFQFDKGACAAQQVERTARHFMAVIDAVSARPDVMVDDIEILPPDERCRILETFNQTDAPFPEGKTLACLFEEQVEKNPGRPAVVWQDRRVTYRELNGKANGLARRLREGCRIRVEDPVAVILERSEDLVTSFLSVLKAGGIYVPVDPALPRARIEWMLKDSQCKAVLTDSRHLSLVPVGLKTVNVDRTEEFCSENPESVTSDRYLAYLIYTSGSTGRPKGVAIEHRSAVNMAAWARRFYGIHEQSRATVTASPSFDASVWEVLPYVLSGACLYPLSDDDRIDTEKLIAFYQSHAITHGYVPPAICEEICRTHRGRLAGAITLLTGGDVLNGIGEGDIEVVNNYGPTECAVVATAVFLRREHILAGIPIGRPIDNTQIFILDPLRRPVPIGTPGEIYIGGVGLARGYWNQPALTAQRFVEHPFQPGRRLYRTGDLGQWLPDGNIMFLGRNDRQVKIRGQRVELGEIEHRLLQHPCVVEAVVEFREGPTATKELVGYVVCKEMVENLDLRKHLLNTLPDHMVPRLFVPMDRLPMTPAGKIDRKALPDPDGDALQRGGRWVEPRTDPERVLAKIWTNILGLERVGIHDNFFDLGGHSLTATRVLSQVRVQLKVDIPLRTIFERPTIAELSRFIERQEGVVAQQDLPVIGRVCREKYRLDR